MHVCMYVCMYVCIYVCMYGFPDILLDHACSNTSLETQKLVTFWILPCPINNKNYRRFGNLVLMTLRDTSTYNSNFNEEGSHHILK